MAVIRKRKPKIVNGYTMFFPVIPIEYMCQANKCEGLQTDIDGMIPIETMLRTFSH